jgi:hypothetical protein
VISALSALPATPAAQQVEWLDANAPARCQRRHIRSDGDDFTAQLVPGAHGIARVGSLEAVVAQV